MSTTYRLPLYFSHLARLAMVLCMADSAGSNGDPEFSQVIASTNVLSRLPNNTHGSPHLLGNIVLHRHQLVPPILSANHSAGEVAGPAEAMVSLLKYAVPDTNLYLLYDDSHAGVNDFLRRHQKGEERSTTVLRYSDNLIPLQEVLTRPPSHTGTRHILLLCSIRHTQQIFQYVSKHNLESARVWWLTVVDGDAWRPLQRLLREGTQVTLAVRTSLTTYRLLTSTVASDGLPRFTLVGTWQLHPYGPVGQMNQPLVPDLYKRYENLEGREIVVAANDNLPFIGLRKLDDGRLVAHSGIDVEILNTLSQFLNFTYRVVSPPDGQWGGLLPDGTISGMIGQVARREVHIAICEITITGSREMVVDFTTPYYLESVALVSRAPAERNRAFAVFSPFTKQVWLGIAVSTLAIGPILAALTKMMAQYVTWPPLHQTSDYSFNMYRSLVVQSNLIVSRNWPIRFVFFFWYLFCFCIYAMYSGTLTAVLALPAFEKPIDGLADLPEAADHGFTLGVVRDSSIEFIFKEAQTGIYKKVWSLFNHEDRSQSFFKYPDQGFEKITEKKFVFLNPQLSSELRATQRGRENYYFSRETFYPQGYGVACNRGAPFLPKLNQMLAYMMEAGLILQWRVHQIMKASENSPRGDSKASRSSAITLKHLQATFFVLVLGFLLAVIMLGVEVITIKLWLSKAADSFSMEQICPTI
ncbi:probable glutamate receptor [Panulirus ornatus]|uniref:probable glutamate receptor n=1 Tax=Panulirus ornatus TaxID=150431 RepID=UPI003A8945EA